MRLPLVTHVSIDGVSCFKQKRQWFTLLLLVSLSLLVSAKARSTSPPPQTYVPRSTTKTISDNNSLFTTTENKRRKNVVTSIRGGEANKKLANLKERSLPAIAMLGGLFLCVKYLNERGFVLLVLLIQMGLYHEGTNVVQWDSTAFPNQPSNNKRSIAKWWWFLSYSLAINGSRFFGEELLPMLTPSLTIFIAYGMILLGIIGLIVKLNMEDAYSYDFLVALRDLSSHHMAIALLVLPSSCWIRTIQDYGMSWVLYPALLVIINDTMAYVFGVACGKHPILPAISPKKTWEGFIGALVSTLILSKLTWNKIKGLDAYYAEAGWVVALYCSLVAPFGGFLASLVKRAYGKKDYSNLIAGHGGFVDRLDCQIITAPFVYLYLNHFLKKT